MKPKIYMYMYATDIWLLKFPDLKKKAVHIKLNLEIKIQILSPVMKPREDNLKHYQSSPGRGCSKAG